MECSLGKGIQAWAKVGASGNFPSLSDVRSVLAGGSKKKTLAMLPPGRLYVYTRFPGASWLVSGDLLQPFGIFLFAQKIRKFCRPSDWDAEKGVNRVGVRLADTTGRARSRTISQPISARRPATLMRRARDWSAINGLWRGSGRPGGPQGAGSYSRGGADRQLSAAEGRRTPQWPRRSGRCLSSAEWGAVLR